MLQIIQASYQLQKLVKHWGLFLNELVKKDTYDEFGGYYLKVDGMDLKYIRAYGELPGR